jgi:recombination DNA repair RAD52 pathway protein
MQVDPRHPLTPLTTTQRAMLLADLNPNRIQSRATPGSSKKMSYLAAWDVRATLIKVFGFGGFSISAEETRVVRIEENVPKRSGGSTPFRVTVQVTTALYIHQLGAIFTGVAMASQSGSDLGEVADFAAKTADSDAMKRAAMNLGTQFGLSLYNNGSNQDVVGQVLAPDQRNMAMRVRTLEEEAQKANIEALEKNAAAGVVIDEDALRQAMDVNVLGDTDAVFPEDEQDVQRAGQPAAPAPRRGRAAPQTGTEAAPVPPQPTEPPSTSALDQVGEAFKQ